MNRSLLIRKIHRIAALVSLVPFLVVVISGILLQLKKEISWIQPATRQGSGFSPNLSLQKILAFTRNTPETSSVDWHDIDRVDIRPDKGIIKVRMKNHREIQVDADSGRILQSAIRRSDIIEDLHTGAWFFSAARLWIFLPSAVVVFFLWISGLSLLIKKFSRKKKRNS